VRICRFAAVVVLAVGMGLVASPSGAGADDTLPLLVTTLQAVLDGVGDVLDTLTSNRAVDPGADITEASVEYAPGWIRMKVKLDAPIDPLRNPRWSDQSYVEWSFDTSGDGNPDYTAEFATEKGELYGAIFDASKPDDPSLCDADSAGFSPQDGYTLVIDPACIGAPKTMGYAVEMFFDTNPNDDKAPMLTDWVPDQGFRPVTAPVQPGEAPSAAPIAPAVAAPPAAAPPAAAPAAPDPGSRVGGGPSPGSPVSGSTPAPRAAAPKPTAAGTPPAGAPGAVAAPAKAEHGGAKGPSPSVTPPAAAPGAAAPPLLARTGSTSEQNALVGLGLMLLGVGMLVMTRPSRPAHQLT
jgi:hypothetical protein